MRTSRRSSTAFRRRRVLPRPPKSSTTPTCPPTSDVDRLDFPGNGPSVCPGTYFFAYGNVGFISLDPNDVSYEITANLG